MTVGPVDPTVHHIEQMAMLATPFGVNGSAIDLRPTLTVSAAEREQAERSWRQLDGSATGGRSGMRLLVNIAAAEARREWPDDRLIAVLRHLAAQAPDVRPLIVAPPGAATRAASVARASGAAAATPGLRQAWALVATADLVFTPDTSLSHAASALRKPAIVLLYRGHEHLAPYGVAGRNVFGEGGTLASISVERVTTAFDEVLAELRAGRLETFP
jgi:ADP-heptose:LPS heptosyltransferase